MGITIDEAIRRIDEHSHIHQHKEPRAAVYITTAFDVAIETMHKYQQIEEIYKNWCYPTHINAVEAMNKLGEVLKDGNVDN